MAGHQPELFHPGVWFKNFALSAIAKEHGATAINLVIDSDVMKSNALIAPGGCSSSPMREAIPFDTPSARLPFEERPILDRDIFGSFGHRVADRIAKLVPRSLIEKFWPMVLERAQSVDRIGYCIAQARHKLEGEWGAKTLEVPQSAVCDGDAFYWFLTHVLAELPRFRNDYNSAVHEYRQANRIRNAAHPVPDLIADGAWMEAPFWIWTKTNPERRRMFAMRRGSEIIIGDREGWELRLPLDAKGDLAQADASDAVAALSAAAQAGMKIRTRALATTLWARLALGDLFLHGIGGAKYDQVTDRLIESFFELPPPGIMVLSATLLLPVDRPTASAEKLRSIRHELRETTYHPERFISASTDSIAKSLIETKRNWIETPLNVNNSYARHAAIDRINLVLQPWVASHRKRTALAEQNQTERDLRCNKILGSRDQGFCLFPEVFWGVCGGGLRFVLGGVFLGWAGLWCFGVWRLGFFLLVVLSFGGCLGGRRLGGVCVGGGGVRGGGGGRSVGWCGFWVWGGGGVGDGGCVLALLLSIVLGGWWCVVMTWYLTAVWVCAFLGGGVETFGDGKVFGWWGDMLVADGFVMD